MGNPSKEPTSIDPSFAAKASKSCPINLLQGTVRTMVDADGCVMVVSSIYADFCNRHSFLYQNPRIFNGRRTNSVFTTGTLNHSTVTESLDTQVLAIPLHYFLCSLHLYNLAVRMIIVIDKLWWCVKIKRLQVEQHQKHLPLLVHQVVLLTNTVVGRINRKTKNN